MAETRIVPAIHVNEDFEQIGGRLKSARTASGLSVEDVVFRTHLPRSVVEALEAEDFSAFASPVYAKSFLAQYSDFLNVDAEPWLDALQPGSFVPAGALQPLLEVPDLPAVEKSHARESRGGWFPILGLLALSAALVFAAIKIFDFFEARFAGERHPAAETMPASQSPPAPPKNASLKKPVFEKEDEELGKPPPRAIIVR